MVHNPNSSNCDKRDDSDCCKECKEYEYCCVTEQICEWIKCPVCEKWMLENCTSLSKICLDFGHNIRSLWLEKLNTLRTGLFKLFKCTFPGSKQFKSTFILCFFKNL